MPLPSDVVTEIQSCRKPVMLILHHKLHNCYSSEYDDAFADASLRLIENYDHVDHSDIMSLLLHYSWEYMGHDMNRRTGEKSRSVAPDIMDSLESMDHDAAVNMVMGHRGKPRELDFTGLPHYKMFGNTLPPVQRLIYELKCSKLSSREMRELTGKSGRYLAVTYFTLRDRYKIWLKTFESTHALMQKNLHRVPGQILRRVALLLIEYKRTSDIAKELKIPIPTAASYVYFARRYLRGEDESVVYSTRIPRKFALRKRSRS